MAVTITKEPPDDLVTLRVTMSTREWRVLRAVLGYGVAGTTGEGTPRAVINALWDGLVSAGIADANLRYPGCISLPATYEEMGL